ncbi:fungal-specific transcription factor domain-containing protein [Schizophyllum commune]
MPKRRRKGAARLSCAECRRLKLRCDRAIPCSSCVKRGCSAICPDGSLTTGQGNRFVLASTQELHEKISELANRVRSLEDALRADHAQLTSEPHPLLNEDLLKIKAPLQREVPTFRSPPSNQTKDEEGGPEVVDAFGSLSISLSGRTKYFGHSANSWYFLQNETSGDCADSESDDPLTLLQEVLPAQILNRAASFPIAEIPPSIELQPIQLRDLLWFLPAVEQASQLRAIYYRHAAWMYNPVSSDAIDEIFRTLYDPSVAHLTTHDPVVSHGLSILFMILAIGSLMDTSHSPYNLEAEKYHQLARAALFQHAFIREPTVNAVQALFLMTFYLFLSDRHGTDAGARWAIMGIATKVAQSVHRDSARLKLIDTAEVQRRRELFWELYTYDSWQCLTFGRPPSFSLAHVDCKMPFPGSTDDANSYHAWKHAFTSECMNLLHDQAFSAKTPSYATVLQLDRKMRAFPVPPVLQVAGFGSSDPRANSYPETVMLMLQRHVVLAIREANLLYLHRSFFARAINDHPKDPLGSPYGTSVIAAYRSAGSLVALMRNLHTQLKEPSERIWFLWTHMFSCSIVLGSIVTRCPSLSLAPSALVQLDSACELFAKAAHGFRAAKVLDIMLRLQQKAHTSLEQWRRGLALQREPGAAGEEDELTVLGGQTRLVKKEPISPTIIDRSPHSHNPVVPLPLSPAAEARLGPGVLDYLTSFGHQNGGGHEHGHQHHQSFSEAVDMSPLSAPGYPSLMPPSAYGGGEGAYGSMQDSNGMMGNGYGMHQQQQDSGHGTFGPGFPQYFPVFDYGSGEAGGYGAGDGYGKVGDGYGKAYAEGAFGNGVPMMDPHPMPNGRAHGMAGVDAGMGMDEGMGVDGRRGSTGSPEAMTWNDFVNVVAMN